MLWIRRIGFLIMGLAVLAGVVIVALPDNHTEAAEPPKGRIEAMLEGKPAKERAQIKSREIVAAFAPGQFAAPEYDLRVQVTAVNEIEGGVEIYARAWRKGEQLGFGADGTVDVERFRIFNPPVLVDDPAGTITRESVLPDGVVTRRLKESPGEAIRQSLSHTISVSGQSGDRIIAGRVGNTTATFYPSMDGRIVLDTDLGTGVDWTTLRDAVNGNNTDIVSNSGIIAWFGSDDVSNKWRRMRRAMYLFDTSTLGVSTIASATLSVHCSSKVNQHTWTPTYNIYSANPASDTALVNADYSAFGTTAFSSAIAYASINTAGYNDWALDATGLAAINKAGISKFGLREAAYDVANVAPAWTSDRFVYIACEYSEETGTSSDPKLVVTYTSNAAPHMFLVF